MQDMGRQAGKVGELCHPIPSLLLGLIQVVISGLEETLDFVSLSFSIFMYLVACTLSASAMALNSKTACFSCSWRAFSAKANSLN